MQGAGEVEERKLSHAIRRVNERRHVAYGRVPRGLVGAYGITASYVRYVRVVV